MKNWRLIFSVLILCYLPILPNEAAADDKECFLNLGKYDQGGFGAVVAKFTTLDGKFSLLAGARGGWIIDHNVILGLSYYCNSALVNEAKWVDSSAGNSPDMYFHQFGLELEYVINTNKAISYSVMMNAGAGLVYYKQPDDSGAPISYKPEYGSDWMAVIEPGLNVSLICTKWMRLTVGTGYRFTIGDSYVYNSNRLTNSAFSAPYGTVQLRFGAF